MNLKKQNGITLIVLIITILVMLIIAGSTIMMLAGEDGLIKSSKESKNILDDYTASQDSKTNRLIDEIDEIRNDREENIAPGGNSSVNADWVMPEIATSVIPSGWKTTTPSDTNWYNYGTTVNEPKLGVGMAPIVRTNEDGSTTKRWANAITTDGSMWVWIPRYAYQITSLYHTESSNSAGNINIKFLSGTTNTPLDGSTVTFANSSGVNNWNVHPCFTDMNDTTTYPKNNPTTNQLGAWDREITGIWVAKFEASHNDATSSAEGSSNTMQFKPNVVSWRSISQNEIFTKCQSYNNTLNSHQMKNSEWGAVAYLSQSTYGKNSEIWINPNINYVTGQAGTSASASTTSARKTNAYDTTNGVNASSTGNVYGIYDLSGGANEYVAAYVNNGNGNITDSSYGGSLGTSTDMKLKQVYPKGNSGDGQSNNYTAAAVIYGDAVYETSSSYINWNSWYGDCSYFPYSSYPFFGRGSSYNIGSNAGAFCFDVTYGSSSGSNGFHVVCLARLKSDVDFEASS